MKAQYGIFGGSTNFQKKLKGALERIKNNSSLIALRVIEAIETNQVKLLPFKDLNPKHYQLIKKNIFVEQGVTLGDYPPAHDDIQKIEEYLDGMLFGDNTIYISSDLTGKKLESTIVHEVTHFINSPIYDFEKNYDPLYKYRDEVRAIKGEFEYKRKIVLRSHIRLIHEQVKHLNPDLVKDNSINYEGIGFLSSMHEEPEDGEEELPNYFFKN